MQIFTDHLTHCFAVRPPLVTEVSRPWHQEGIYRRGMSSQTLGALGQSIEARLPDGVRIKDGLSPWLTLFDIGNNSKGG